MGGLIEFFIANPFLLILLIGAITGLFGKKSKQEEQKRRQQQRQQQAKQQTQAQTQSSYPDNETGYIEEKVEKKSGNQSYDWDIDIFNESKEELEKKLRETFSPYLEKKKEPQVTSKNASPSTMKDRVEELSIKQQEITKNSPIFKQELQISEGKVLTNHKINPKRVVEGVMWAEILGQPRSRNPHHPVYTQYSAASKRKG